MHRFLMLWFFVALQALAPFIHAHAGAVHLHHAGFLHLHETAAHGEAVWHAMVADDHGTEVAVAAGLPARISLSAAADASPAAVNTLPAPEAVQRPACGLPALAERPPAPPDHARPFALAPPAA